MPVNDSPSRLRRLLMMFVVLVGFGAVAALILIDRSRNATALRQLRQEAADLHVQLEARDGTISWLQADVQQLRSGAMVADGQQITCLGTVAPS